MVARGSNDEQGFTDIERGSGTCGTMSQNIHIVQLEPGLGEQLTDTIPAFFHIVIEPVIRNLGELGHIDNVLRLDKVPSDPIAETHQRTRGLCAETASYVAEETASAAECALDVDRSS